VSADHFQPGTTLFQRYARCSWTISVSTGNLDFTSPLSFFRATLTSKSQAQYTDEVRLTVPMNGKKKKRAGSPANGADEPMDAMLLDRIGEGGLDGVIGVGSSSESHYEGA